MAQLDQGCLSKMLKASKLTIKGRVQGVGFRPFIFQLAEKYDIKGTVQNNMDGVRIVAEGEEESLQQMIDEVKLHPPRLSRVDSIDVVEMDPKGYQDFMIIPSERTGKSSLVIPVDSAVCEDCLLEMKDPTNFRYRYPFINCTQCGPRYTIISELPYDRPYTVMSSFEMCESCQEEYENPNNRRHHAQPIACVSCGPDVELLSIDGEGIGKGDQAIKKVQQLLKQGFIVAIKGLGGYHLACDALNEETISRLRERKRRPNRPLAVMAASMEIVRDLCYIGPKEKETLQSPESPIVVLMQKQHNQLPKNLAPGLKTLGVMFPYTPLHHLLFDDPDLRLLVMTSANPSGMPILYKDEEARKGLKGIADFILTTNREILHPLDDSVVQVIDGEITFLRRSRGYVPDPISTQQPVHDVIALGGQQKNTFAIGRHEQIFLGPHIGDMDHLEVVDFFKNEFHHLMKWMGTQGKVIAIDMHPQFTTRRLAEDMQGKMIEVQHHHAHHVACMEDNQLTEPVYGIILDGTGYGEDGNIWGFEILYGDARSFKRLAHLTYTPLPGGEKAIKEPWRNAVGMMIGYLGEKGVILANQLFKEKEYEIDILKKMIEKKVNTPLAGTSGRLFDAVSAMLGICHISTYDGEAAIRLSEMMPEEITIQVSYPFEIKENGDQGLEIDFTKMIDHITQDILQKKPVVEIVQLFHQTVVSALVGALLQVSSFQTDWNRKVVLSGGSFHNSFLTAEMKSRLSQLGFEVYTHKKVPCNDGGIAFGQLIIAANAINRDSNERI